MRSRRVTSVAPNLTGWSCDQMASDVVGGGSGRVLDPVGTSVGSVDVGNCVVGVGSTAVLVGTGRVGSGGTPVVVDVGRPGSVASGPVLPGPVPPEGAPLGPMPPGTAPLLPDPSGDLGPLGVPAEDPPAGTGPFASDGSVPKQPQVASGASTRARAAESVSALIESRTRFRVGAVGQPPLDRVQRGQLRRRPADEDIQRRGRALGRCLVGEDATSLAHVGICRSRVLSISVMVCESTPSSARAPVPDADARDSSPDTSSTRRLA